MDKIDKSGISDQELMQKVVRYLTGPDIEIFQDTNKVFLPISKWKGVTLNEKGKVIEIFWHKLFKEKHDLSFVCLPPSLKRFTARSCCLVGNVDLRHLPEGLEWFSVSDNELTGTVNLNMLPNKLKFLHLEGNELSGHIDVKNAPASLESLLLHDNNFDKVDLSALPCGLKYLSLNNNKFEGEVDLTYLPAGMRMLYLCNNRFSGETDFSKLPPFLVRFDISNTDLSGEICLSGKTDYRVKNSKVRIIQDPVELSFEEWDAQARSAVEVKDKPTTSDTSSDSESSSSADGESDDQSVGEFDIETLPNDEALPVAAAEPPINHEEKKSITDFINDLTGLDDQSIGTYDMDLPELLPAPVSQSQDMPTSSPFKRTKASEKVVFSQTIDEAVDFVEEVESPKAKKTPSNKKVQEEDISVNTTPSSKTAKGKPTKVKVSEKVTSENISDEESSEQEDADYPVNTRIMRSSERDKRKIEEKTPVKDKKKATPKKRKV